MRSAPFSKQALSKAKDLLAHAKISELLFSGGTYQVELVYRKKSYWPVLQLGDHGEIKSSLCSCKEGELCSHLAAAWLAVLHGYDDPLHIRFKASFWATLSRLFHIKYREEVVERLSSKKGEYSLQDITGKTVFTIKPKTAFGKNWVKKTLLERVPETEETSLKFSNLSEEELELWREGRPTEDLEYELSFWSDLAKKLFLDQEAGVIYDASFFPIDEIPSILRVDWPDLFLEFYVAQVDLPELIVALGSIKTNLSVSQSLENVKKITYDPEKKRFLLKKVLADPETGREERGISIGNWWYLPGKGFSPKQEDAWLQEAEIPQERIPSFLTQYHSVLANKFENLKINNEIKTLDCNLFFDASFTLHIEFFLFQKGDLLEKGTYFPPWVFIQEKGNSFSLYRVRGSFGDALEISIEKERVADFVTKHRQWLSRFSGFEVHTHVVESNLSYQASLTETSPGIYHNTPGELLFIGGLDSMVQEGMVVDFGDWVYLKGRGFFSKGSYTAFYRVRPGLKISAHRIGSFIEENVEELEAVLHFFASRTPLKKSGLTIELDREKRIHVSPFYQVFPEYQTKRVDIFGNYTFVSGEGFYPIPMEMRLEERYQEQVMISKGEEAYFLGSELKRLSSQIVHLDRSLEEPKELKLSLQKLEYLSGLWYLTVDYRSEFGSLPVREIWQGVLDKEPYLLSSAGTLWLREVRFDWLKSLIKHHFVKNSVLKLSTLEWMRLLAFEDLQVSPDFQESQLLEEFYHQKSITSFDLKGLQSELRPYQESGVAWLWFLYTYGLSGLLCDEMGLGKTHQAMALLAAARNFLGGTECKSKFLVVCPTSVLFHWEELLKKFLPNWRVVIFYGTLRKQIDLEGEYDLLLTSYGALRSDIKEVSKIPFAVAILDEIQVAKNHNSLIHKSVRQVQALSKIGLTGTPIENRLLELKALFDVVLPGYMPSAHVFKELFVHPIEKQNDGEKKKLLGKLVHPFVLRRRKSEVLSELPEKIETISYVELSPIQKRLYDTAYLEARASLIPVEGDEGPSYVHVFALLTRLKQICDHPLLVDPEIDPKSEELSGKWDLFLELLEEARESGQKVVVFSQYLGMLDLIEGYLKRMKIGFASLRGSTKDRRSPVKQFRDDPKCEVFVGSLQAAGVGIDLVAASVVIHYDRWWNPAKENQATDRVHRIGQSRGVQVFKLVTKETIEEHIHHLIERKLGLLESVVSFDDQEMVKRFSKEEILELIRLMDRDVR